MDPSSIPASVWAVVAAVAGAALMHFYHTNRQEDPGIYPYLPSPQAANAPQQDPSIVGLLKELKMVLEGKQPETELEKAIRILDGVRANAAQKESGPVDLPGVSALNVTYHPKMVETSPPKK